ncbi:hypothetical protein K402DRAFT_334814 [Aulographum hederae CBS 113979]|uniref:SnoaL-like domain-containing protein n=1 Tax=Aulographum hederae CBS 113979 TaxID=1176131 RepID=A0A6G1GWT1_9PEZI|nr:hypothetical protein K402DRAFT_334814 [Aulographum hederae CBS 113979]
MSYTSIYPSVGFNPTFKRFIEDFYRISDTPDAHDEYADQYASDATLIMASKSAKGEILALRKSLWEKVASRSHKPLKVFPSGPNSNEVMIYGTVDYKLKDGRESSVDWAARGVLVEEDGKTRWADYQVYLDSAAQSPGK